MLVMFAVVGVLGVLMLVFSIVLGMVLLLVAEVFFAVAYRRFSRRSKTSS